MDDLVKRFTSQSASIAASHAQAAANDTIDLVGKSKLALSGLALAFAGFFGIFGVITLAYRSSKSRQTASFEWQQHIIKQDRFKSRMQWFITVGQSGFLNSSRQTFSVLKRRATMSVDHPFSECWIKL